MTKTTSKNIWIIVSTLSVIAVFCLVGPFFAPNDPLETNLANVLLPPNAQYPLGTDQVGRCILSRLLYGARISIGLTFSLLTLVSVIGFVIGLVAALRGKWLDATLMRAADMALAFPEIIFVIAVVGMLGPGVLNMILALSLIWWTKYARLTRTLVMRYKTAPFVEAGRMAGASNWQLLKRYIFPNIASPLVVQYMLDIGGMMLTIASLSFLGLGVQAPTPEWGSMLSEGRTYIQTAPWLLYYPGIAIFIIVIIFNLLGDKIRDWLDPRLGNKGSYRI